MQQPEEIGSLTIEMDIGVILSEFNRRKYTMKTFLLSLALLSLVPLTHAEDIQSTSSWIDTNTVLLSNSQSYEIARRDCETTMRILSIMSNDKIVFRSSCEPSYNPRCIYYFCYQLCTKAFVVPDHDHDHDHAPN